MIITCTNYEEKLFLHCKTICSYDEIKRWIDVYARVTHTNVGGNTKRLFVTLKRNHYTKLMG